MRINSLHLKGFKRFSNSRIFEMNAKFVSNAVIIAASNASGKTSMLRELSPLPSKSENYNKGGYKELNITHNNDEYILSATYDRNVNYSFIKNGVELNLNGLFNNQKELVEKHLGFTDTIEKLVYNKFAICRSTVQERKDLFTKINSMNLELVDAIYKLAKVSEGISLLSNVVFWLYIKDN